MIVVLLQNIIHKHHHHQAPAAVQADATVARARDLGTNDITHFVRTHLGGVLAPGDEAVGYDLEGVTSIDEEAVAEAPQAVLLVDKRRKREEKKAKRGSGAARRRRRKGGAGGGDDGSSSICSGTSYQSEASELLDALDLADDDEGAEAADEFAPLDAGLGEFWGAMLHGDAAEEHEDEDEQQPEDDQARGHAPGASAAGASSSGGST